MTAEQDDLPQVPQSEQGVPLSQWTTVRTRPARRPDGSVVYVKAEHVIAGLEPDPDPNADVAEVVAVTAAAAGSPDAGPAVDVGDDDAADASVDEATSAGPVVVEAHQFTHPGHVLVPSGAKARAAANLAAIEVVHRCEDQSRPATPDEQDTLAQWSGWGAIPEIFDPRQAAWAGEHAALRTQLSDDEYRAARASTVNAHYTDPAIAQAMWQALLDAGFDGGYVLEPGCGSGNFIGGAPPSATMIGVENDAMTARIAHLLYPHAQIRNEGFEITRIPDGTFSAVIGNVPFGDFEVPDRVHNPQGHNIHNHFLLKSLNLTAPGGYVLAITSSGTLDSASPKARQDMHRIADLVGAIRLPGNAFTRVAGTQVVTDILVLRRREADVAPATGLQPWIESVKTEVPDLVNGGTTMIDINEYFVRRPGNVIGRLSAGHGLYRGNSMRVESTASGEQLAEAVSQKLGELISGARTVDGVSSMVHSMTHQPLTYSPQPVQPSDDAVLTLEAGVATAEMLYGEDVAVGHTWWDEESQTFQRKGITGTETIKVPATRTVETRHLLRLRDEVSQVIAAQREGSDAAPAERESLRAQLNRTFDAYVSVYGPINRSKITGGKERTPAEADKKFAALEQRWRTAEAGEDGVPYEGELPETVAEQIWEQAWTATPRVKRQTHLEAVRNDPGMAGVLALEIFDDETGTARKAAVFARDVVTRPAPAIHAESPEDALAISLGESGHVDLGRIGELLGQTPQDARESVRGLVYRDVHNPDILLPASTALSGNVRAKHDLAARALLESPDDAEWVEVERALSQVIPATKFPGQMGPVKIGASWIPGSDYEQFIRDTFGATDVSVQHAADGWVVTVPAWQQNSPLMRIDYGAEHAHNANKSLTAVDLFERLINQRTITVKNTDKEREDRGLPEVDAQASVFAQVQADKISAEFRDWLWRDEQRHDRLVPEWNRRFNTWVRPEHDGSRLQLPGLSAAFEPHPYQRNAVARVVAEPSVLLDHVVGAGKTGTMFMAAMELKRRGLVNQPWIVVPLHLIEQFGRELPQWYPAANVLVGSKGMTAEDRRVFVAQTATSDWDLVIIPDSVFERIRVHPQRRVEFIQSQLDELADELMQGSGQQKDRTIKRIELAKKALTKKLEKATDQSKKDPGVTFEMTGCDYLFIDEAHGYKNRARTCSIDTLSLPKGADKADDLAMKMYYLRERAQQRAAAAGLHVPAGAERVATFATGTPIANSLAEAWVMQSYLRPDVLEAAGVRSINDWAASFTTSRSETVTNATGTRIMVVSKVSSFSNPREMFEMAAQYTDVVVRDQVPANLPQFDGRTVITTTPGQEVRDFITDLEYRLSNLNPKRPQVDNVLKVMNDGRNVALDPMLANLPPDPGNTRADAVANKVAAIYHANKDNQYRTAEGAISPTPGALQLVFCDRGTPSPGKRSVYDNLRDLLVDNGVPQDQIAYMQHAKTASQKLALQDKCRNGSIAVLIGSTPTMGTGLNVQARMVALHHMDVPWRPADLEQREGRCIRQGNQNARIDLCSYVTEGTTDTVMWATVESKATFIQQAKTGQISDDVTEVADINDDDLAASAAATKAAATGDPRYIRMAELETDLASLEALSNAHEDARNQARSIVRKCDREIDTIEANHERAQEIAHDVAAWVERGKHFRVGNKTSDKRPERSALLLERARAAMVELKRANKGLGDSVELATFDDTGLTARCARSAMSDELYVFIETPVGRPQFYISTKQLWGSASQGNGEGSDNASSLASGLATRLENMHSGLAGAPERLHTRLTELRAEIDVQTPRLDTPFARQNDLVQMRADLQVLMLEIKASENSEAAIEARAQAEQRMLANGREPGWSLELNPTEATIKQSGLDKESFILAVQRRHTARAVAWQAETADSVNLAASEQTKDDVERGTEPEASDETEPPANNTPPPTRSGGWRLLKYVAELGDDAPESEYSLDADSATPPSPPDIDNGYDHGYEDG